MQVWNMQFFGVQTGTKLQLPLFNTLVPAGFPSPADDYMEGKIDLNQKLIQHPDSTFFVKVTGNSMTEAGIFPDDIIIVDRQQQAKHGDIILACLDGEFTVKQLSKKAGKISLIPANPNYQPIQVEEDQVFQVWGVVTYVIHKPSI
jgi:DNA polymerase V